MACISTTLSGATIDCGVVGGLKKLHLAAVDAVTSVTVALNEISAITMNGTNKFKEFAFRRGNANFVSTGNVDDSAGTAYVETVVSGQFNAMDTAKRTAMQELMGTRLYAIAEDYSGNLWFIGYGSYGFGSVNAQSGASMGDSNNYTVTITFQTPEMPYALADGVTVPV